MKQTCNNCKALNIGGIRSQPFCYIGLPIEQTGFISFKPLGPCEKPTTNKKLIAIMDKRRKAKP